MKDSAIYAVGTVASRLVGFIMIPVYTRVLTPADYGIIETIVRLVDVIGLFLGLGLAEALLRHYFLAQNEEDRRRLISTTLSINLAVIVAGCLIALPSSPLLARLAFGHDRYTLYVTVSLISMLIGNLGQLPMTLWRAEGKAWRFTVISLASLLSQLTTNIILVVWLRLGVWGVVLSGLINAVLWSATLGLVVWRRYGLQVDRVWVKPVLRYGLPLVPASLSQFVLHFSDRFFLTRYATEAQLGLYSLGYRFGMLVSVFSGIVWMAWAPWAFRVGTEEAGEIQIHRASSLFLVGFAFVTCLIILFAHPTIHFLSAPRFWGASHLVPLLAISYWAFAVQYPSATVIRLARRTDILAGIQIVAAVLCTCLNLLLIPRYGVWGAVWATFLSFSALLILTEIISYRFETGQRHTAQLVPWLGSLSAMVMCAAVSFLCARLPLPFQVFCCMLTAVGVFCLLGAVLYVVDPQACHGIKALLLRYWGRISIHAVFRFRRV